MNMKNSLSKAIYLISFLSILAIASVILQGINKTKNLKNDEKGEALFWEGKNQEVKELWKKEWEEKKEIGIARKLSVLYIKEGWIKEGIAFHKEALKIYPDDPKLRFNLSLLYFQAEKWKNAWGELDKIKVNYPLFPNLHYLRGLILEKEGKEKEAYKEFINELNNYPECAGAWEKIRLFSKKGIEN